MSNKTTLSPALDGSSFPLKNADGASISSGAGDSSAKRPILRYHGGKWKLAPWIVAHMPGHKIYVEPYGGAASVLLRKPRSYMETYNDLDGEVVNLFRVARDRGQELREVLSLTPFAREEFFACYAPAEDPLERARRIVVRSFMGFGGAGALRESPTGFRAVCTKARTPPPKVFRGYPAGLASVIERLQGVVIESRPAMDVMRAADSPVTLHYVDPPYVPEARDPGGDYRHEMTVGDHLELAAFLKTLKGMVILSGYNSPAYEREYADWRKVETEHRADHPSRGYTKRTEVLWMRNIKSDDLFQPQPA